MRDASVLLLRRHVNARMARVASCIALALALPAMASLSIPLHRTRSLREESIIRGVPLEKLTCVC